MNNLIEQLNEGFARKEIPNRVNKREYNYKRGDIVMVDKAVFGVGNGIKVKDRMAVVIQNNIGNYHSSNLIVSYFTSVVSRRDLPTHVSLREDTEGIYKESICMTEHLQTVDKDYVKFVGKVFKEDLEQIEKAIITSIALEEYIQAEIEKALAEVKKTLPAKKTESDIKLGKLLRISGFNGLFEYKTVEEKIHIMLGGRKTKLELTNQEVKILIDELQELLQYQTTQEQS